MKKLLAVLIAGAFATSAFAVEASAPAGHMNGMEKPAASATQHSKKKHTGTGVEKTSASSTAKHSKKKHKAKHHKSKKKAASAA